MFKLLLALLVTLTPYHLDPEPADQRAERMQVVAYGIDNAPSARDYELERDRDLKLALATLGDIESRYYSRAHAEALMVATSVAPVDAPALAPELLLAGAAVEAEGTPHASPFQVAYGDWLEPEEFLAMVGTTPQATLRAARYAAKPLRYGLASCGAESRDGRLLAAFSVAATGRCEWSGARARVDRLYRYEQRMARLATRL